MIDSTKLRILSNYVLVKPDEYHDEYNCGILTSSYKYDEKGEMHSTEMEHIAVSGVVYAVPERLIFKAEQIWDLQDGNDFRSGTFVRQPYIQQKIDRYRNESVQFNVPVEVGAGDKVYFDYMAHKLSQQILTSEGWMMLIKYDLLILAIRIGEVKMLNGILLVENEKYEQETTIILDKEEKRTRNRAKATVISAGAPVSMYLDFRGYQDGDAEQGDTILYDPRYAKELEFGLHRIFSDRKLLRIQRKDIYAVLEENSTEVSYI